MKDIKKIDMNEFAKTCLEYDLKSKNLVKLDDETVAFANILELDFDESDDAHSIEDMLTYYIEIHEDYTEEDIRSIYEQLQHGLKDDVDITGKISTDLYFSTEALKITAIK